MSNFFAKVEGYEVSRIISFDDFHRTKGKMISSNGNRNNRDNSFLLHLGRSLLSIYSLLPLEYPPAKKLRKILTISFLNLRARTPPRANLGSRANTRGGRVATRVGRVPTGLPRVARKKGAGKRVKNGLTSKLFSFIQIITRSSSIMLHISTFVVSVYATAHPDAAPYAIRECEKCEIF